MGFIKKIILFAILVNSSFLSAQEKAVLYEQSFEEISDTINKYLYIDEDKAISASKVFLKKAKAEKNIENEYLGMEAIAAAYLYNRNFSEADKSYQRALAFAKNSKIPKLLIRSYLLGVQIHIYSNNITSAFELLDKALLLSEKTDDPIQKELVLSTMASVLQIAGNNIKAIEIRKKTNEVLKSRKIDSLFTKELQKESLFYSYSVISTAYIDLKEADSAGVYISKMQALIAEKDSCLIRTLLITKGELAFYKKEYDTAQKNFEKAIEYCDLKAPLINLRTAYLFGKVAHAQGKFYQAKSTLQGGLDIYKVTPSEEAFMDNYYKLLADSYKEIGEFERAGYYFEKYINTSSEYNKLKDEVEELAKKKELKKFQSELDMLEYEKSKKQNYLNYLFLGASLIILGLLFVLLRFYKTKKKNEVKFGTLLEKMKTTSEENLNIIDTKDEILEEKNSIDVPEEIKLQILEGLLKLEKQEFFLKQECTSYNVAKKISTNTTYLSKVINSHYGKNFNTYINDLRINYTIIRLKNDVIFRSYSIQAIAEEVGYKSADSFTKYFKKDTGLNPSFYIKEIKNIA